MKRSDIPTIEVLKACQEPFPREDTPFQFLVDKFNAPLKVVYSAMERDSDNGLIEYGVSLACSWLTRKGTIYIERHNEKELDNSFNKLGALKFNHNCLNINTSKQR